MFRDMELSKDINVAFKQHMDHLSNAADYKIDMTVSVLSMAYWPTYQPMEVNIPGNIITIFYTGILLWWEKLTHHPEVENNVKFPLHMECLVLFWSSFYREFDKTSLRFFPNS